MSTETAIPLTADGDAVAFQRSCEERLCRGDRTVLAALFQEHRARLLRLVGFRMDRRLHGRVDPDDVLQEAFLAAAQRLPYYDPNTSPSPYLWMRLVVLQTIVDVHRFHLRAQMRNVDRERCLPGEGASPTSTSLAMCLMSPGTSPSQVVLRRETLAQIERALARLDAQDQEILVLRHFEELNNGEVAELLGLQAKAASLRYVRAVRRLRSALANHSGFFEV